MFAPAYVGLRKLGRSPIKGLSFRFSRNPLALVGSRDAALLLIFRPARRPGIIEHRRQNVFNLGQQSLIGLAMQ
jgi:hypothetical protein